MIALISLLLAGQAPVTPPPVPTAAPMTAAPALAPRTAESMALDDGLQLVCYSGADHFGGGIAGRQVELDLQGSRGRIQLPHGLATGQGKPKWVEVTDLAITDRAVDGSIAKDFLTHSPLHIDRITGMIAIGGKKPAFVGRCETYDQAVARRAF